MSMEIMFQSKDNGWLISFKKKTKTKTQLYAAYKRLTSVKHILRLKVTFSIFMRYLS